MTKKMGQNEAQKQKKNKLRLLGLLRLWMSTPSWVSSSLDVCMWMYGLQPLEGVVLRVTRGGRLRFAASQHPRSGDTPDSKHLLAWPAAGTRQVDRTPRSTSPGHPEGRGGERRGQQDPLDKTFKHTDNWLISCMYSLVVLCFSSKNRTKIWRQTEQ